VRLVVVGEEVQDRDEEQRDRLVEVEGVGSSAASRMSAGSRRSAFR